MGSSCQENTWGSFHPRVPHSLEGRSLLCLDPSSSPHCNFQMLYSMRAPPSLPQTPCCPSSHLALHPFIFSKGLDNRKTWPAPSIQAKGQILLSAPGISADKYSRPAAFCFKPSYRPRSPPTLRFLDVKGIRSTAGLFLCSRGSGSGENIQDVSRKRPQH